VQVVAPAMYKAFRLADVHNNICRVASGDKDIGSRTFLIGKCSRELRDNYISSGGARIVGRREIDSGALGSGASGSLLKYTLGCRWGCKNRVKILIYYA
ncbi:MAG: hypothetical protein VB962_07940, partial [Pseudohongiellaceae bacterium]